MKNSTTLANSVVNAIGNEPAEKHQSDDNIHDRQFALAVRLAAELFPVLSTYYPDFTARVGGMDQTKIFALAKEYASRLIARSVGQKGLSIGLERLKAESMEIKWAPNPEQFAHLCQPTAQQLGIPTFDEAKAEVIKARGERRGTNYEFSHVLTHELNRLAGYDMYSLSDKAWTIVLKKAYEKLFKHALGGTLTKQEPLTLIENKAPSVQVEHHPIDWYLTHKDPFMRKLGKMRLDAQQRAAK